MGVSRDAEDPRETRTNASSSAEVSRVMFVDSVKTMQSISGRLSDVEIQVRDSCERLKRFVYIRPALFGSNVVDPLLRKPYES